MSRAKPLWSSLGEWEKERPPRMDEYSITAEDNNRPVFEGCDDPQCECLIECSDGEQDIEGYIARVVGSIPVLLAEIERLRRCMQFCSGPCRGGNDT